MKTKRLFMLFSIFVLSLASYAQKELSKSVSTLKNKNEFIETFIKNIAIDKEDYNIYVDYIDKEKGTIIFSGIAKDVGNLTVEVYDVIKSNLAFKVELSFQNSNSTKKWLLTPLNLKLSFQKGEREPYSFLPTSTLEEIRQFGIRI